MTRVPTGRKRKHDGSMVGGRPLGFLTGFLSLSFTAKTRAEHKSFVLLNAHLGARDMRERHRAMLVLTQDGRDLTQFERPVEEGESEEPFTLEGLLKDDS